MSTAVDNSCRPLSGGFVQNILWKLFRRDPLIEGTFFAAIGGWKTASLMELVGATLEELLNVVQSIFAAIE